MGNCGGAESATAALKLQPQPPAHSRHPPKQREWSQRTAAASKAASSNDGSEPDAAASSPLTRCGSGSGAGAAATTDLLEDRAVTSQGFVLEAVLSSGAYGVVYRASHKTDSARRAAVKVVPAEAVAELTPHRLMQEASVMAALAHPNVVRLHGLDLDPVRRSVWLSMEFVDGPDLRTVIAETRFRGFDGAGTGGLVTSIASSYFRQVLRAVRHIHGRGFAHRDLKAENILVCRTTGDVKVADFGFAVEQPAGGGLLSRVCGTPAYVAPEVAAGRRYCGFRADLWSLGVLLHAMLTASVPVRGGGFAAVERLAAEMVRGGGLQVPGHVSEEGEDLIHRLMVVDPEGRMTPGDALEHPFIIMWGGDEEDDDDDDACSGGEGSSEGTTVEDTPAAAGGAGDDAAAAAVPPASAAAAAEGEEEGGVRHLQQHQQRQQGRRRVSEAEAVKATLDSWVSMGGR